jgi:HEPN domain-containing protein
VRRIDFQRLADVRIEEAEVLFKAKKYDGAYYLAGYAVECALKACIAKSTRRHDFPDKQFVNKCHTHNVEELVLHAGLKAMLQTDAALMLRWAIMKDWNEQSRYERKTRVEAKALYDAITDPAHGVLQWIKSHW